MKTNALTESQAADGLSRASDNRKAARALAVALISLRSARGMSQTQLAEKAKVSRSTVNCLESGQGGPPTVRTLRLVAEALEVTPDTLMGFEEACHAVTQRKEADGSITMGFGPNLERR